MLISGPEAIASLQNDLGAGAGPAAASDEKHPPAPTPMDVAPAPTAMDIATHPEVIDSEVGLIWFGWAC